jgi:hypothetical protein
VPPAQRLVAGAAAFAGLGNLSDVGEFRHKCRNGLDAEKKECFEAFRLRVLGTVRNESNNRFLWAKSFKQRVRTGRYTESR